MYGGIECLMTPIGLCNAPVTYQTVMNRNFWHYMDILVVVYLDGLVMFSENEDDLLNHMAVFFSRLKQYKLYGESAKFSFMERETDLPFLMVIKKN